MKKLNFIAATTITICMLLYSCNNKKQEETTSQETPKSMVEDAPSGIDAKIAEGKLVYEKVCQACHQADGKGLPNAFPPLANSDYLAADIPRAISGVVNGLSGEITVNGAKFNQTMPASTLSDEEIASAFTYVLNNFDNKGGEVNAADVKATRK